MTEESELKKLKEKIDFILEQKVNSVVVTDGAIEESTVTFVRVYSKNESSWYLNCPHLIEEDEDKQRRVPSTSYPLNNPKPQKDLRRAAIWG